VPSHQFLCSLLQFYDLELNHLTPSRILHMAAFVMLCVAYMGIEPPLQFVELLLLRLPTKRLECGNDVFGQCGHLCLIQAWS
jgi:hypothetical protein